MRYEHMKGNGHSALQRRISRNHGHDDIQGGMFYKLHSYCKHHKEESPLKPQMIKKEVTESGARPGRSCNPDHSFIPIALEVRLLHLNALLP